MSIELQSRDRCFDGHDWDYYDTHYYETHQTEDLKCRNCGLIWLDAAAYYYTEEEMIV